MTKQLNVMDYGAVADGKTKATAAIRAVVDASSSAGGGTVCFPPGTYLTGPITLASNLNLHVEEGATVLFTRDYEDYPLRLFRREGCIMWTRTPLVYGAELENVAITGKGAFDGSGEVWRPVKKGKVGEAAWEQTVASGGAVNDEQNIWWPTRQAMEAEKPVLEWERSGVPAGDVEAFIPWQDGLRPVLLGLWQCRDVLLDGPSFLNPPFWTIQPVMCENVTARNLTVRNPWHASNGDGINPDSCRNVLIEHCFFSTGDDCIAIISGKGANGRREGRPCEDVLVRHCRMERGHGGVVIGSGTAGSVRNVRVHDCTFDGTDNGLRFKTGRGMGGTVEDVRITDITMSSIRSHAIVFNMYYPWDDPGPGPVTEGTPRFRDFHISNVTCDGAGSAMQILGLPEMPVEAITLENVNLKADNGATLEHGKDITLSDVRIEAGTAPAFECHSVENLTLARLDASAAAEKSEGI